MTARGEIGGDLVARLEADRERFFAALASQEPEELVERAERWARAMR
jgi:hypothetical protein